MMRWYSVKKYVPPDGSWLIVRLLHNDGWDIYVTGSNTRLDGVKDRGFWEFICFDDEKYKDKYTITHFATIEPVEIEE